MTTFERFMGNTIKWRSLDECTSFINYVVNEEDNYTLTDIKDRTKEEVVNKLLNEMQEPKPLYKQVIERLISHLDQNKLNKLYYKNNFYDFIANESILELYNEMISLKDVDILDPNEIPDVFVDTLEKLWFSLKEYVFHNFITYNKIEILKHNPREVVLAVDTDSNFCVPRCA